jgi:hypothetical protein
MARIFPRNISQQRPGQLIVETLHPGVNKVYFVPPAEKLADLALDSNNPQNYKTHILDIDSQRDSVSIYPVNTLGAHDDFLEPKYPQISSITLEGFELGSGHTADDVIELLEGLPSGFVKDHNYGLGLLKEYRFLISVLEEHGIEHLVISKTKSASIDEAARSCTIKHTEFETIRKHLDRITREARGVSNKVKIVTANNSLAFFLNDEHYPQKPLNIEDTTLAKLIARKSPSIEATLSKAEQNEAIALLSKNHKAIAKDQPEALVKLHNEIELVTLEQLIDKFREMLNKGLPESRWQKLFNDNPFILNLAFGYPVIIIQDQAHVGGRTISGAGDKIADFLAKNSISNNAALFEIKTPSTPLLNKRAYREGVYTPSSDLSGALNQMLDQKIKFQQEIAAIKHNSGIHDIESYAVHGVLVVGTMPAAADRKKSFELFRGNSKDISIITFDECFEKLRQLQAFLQ